MEQATTNVSKQNKYYLDVLAKWFSGLEELRRYFAGAKLFKIGEQASNKVENAHIKQTAAQQELIVLSGFCNLVGQMLLLSLTAFFITKNAIIFGAIMSVQNFAANVSIGLQQVIEGLSFMKSSKELMGEISRYSSVINKNEADGEEPPLAFTTKNLSLNFPNGEKLTFPDINVKPGEKILLSGDSGAGKSTLFKLILGELKASTGKVEFQNATGDTIIPDMSRIGYIPQDPNLFPGTIKENITMFNDQLDSRVEKTVNEVNFNKDIKKFKNGINEELDLDKINISGGQRQKIVLARAKIHDSDIILIDEGTSAIDQKATMNILEKLLNSKATLVFIAHNFNEHMRQMFDREIYLSKE
jgi:ABC-type bacteriocin/lantibiotic exporter with double-glycine peptidase domain